KNFIIENKFVNEEEIHRQNRQIAEWAVRNKNWESAVNHFLEINEFDQAVSCIEKLYENGWNNAEKLDLYIRQLPEKHYHTISAYLEKGKKTKALTIPGENIITRLGIILKINFGWLVCLLLPLLTYYWANTQGFNWDQKLFLSILASAVIMWMFKLVADYIVSIFIIIACLTLKAVPSHIILEGFTSGAFFLAMSIFGLGAVLVSSGLIYRVSLMILYYFPSTLFWQNLALSLVGTFVTPVVPSANGRLALVSPIIMDMTETMRFKPLSKAGVRLSMSALSGFGLMSNFFLTGKSINFVLLGLLSIDLQNRFSFLYWMIAAGMAGVVCFIGRFFVAAEFYKAETSPKISKDEIKNQLSIMGKFNFSEWIAVLSSFIFLMGVMTSTLHKIRTPWVGVLILFLVLFVGELGKEDFKKEIDWPFLLFLGGLIGFVKAFSYLHLDLWIGKQLTFLAVFMTQNFFVFIILLSIIIVIVRLVLPANATVALLCAVLIPVAGIKGINPWIVGFCILLMSSGWFFPYQSTFYTTFLETTKGKMFTDKQTAPFHIWTNLINLLALLLSVPYWKALGLLK
ncbi:MAG: SLC13 family permease, partial [Thermodesulfobacteriota bacterium]|nr:SLC13 family permease [Thermodesulfobacteriota bacterium]